MRRILRVAPYLSARAFAAWCGLALKGDLAQLSGGALRVLAAWGALATPRPALVARRTLSQAIVITLTCRLVTLWLAVALGWGAVLSLRQRTSALAWTFPSGG